MIDPATGKILPDEMQIHGGGQASQDDADGAQDDDGLAQDRANGYSGGQELKEELEAVLKTVRGALKHEADLAKQLMHKVESKIHQLLKGIKKGN